LVQPVLREKLVLGDHRVKLVPRVLPVLLVLSAKPVLPVLLVLSVKPVLPVLLVLSVKLVLPDLPVLSVKLVLPDLPVQRDLKRKRESQVLPQ